jgi:hypothetical protein
MQYGDSFECSIPQVAFWESQLERLENDSQFLFRLTRRLNILNNLVHISSLVYYNVLCSTQWLLFMNKKNNRGGEGSINHLRARDPQTTGS